MARPTILTDELKTEIASAVLEMNERPTMAKVSEKVDIKYSTFKEWVYRNYNGFADDWRSMKHEWKLKQADLNTDEILLMKTGDDPKMLKIKADMTKFVQETLGKQNYSKRSEQTGAGGGPITVQTINYADYEEDQPKD